MISVVVPVLFGFFCLLAVAAVVVTLRQYGGSIVALRDEVRQGSPRRVATYRIAETRRTAEIRVLPVRRRAPTAQPLPAAA